LVLIVNIFVHINLTFKLSIMKIEMTLFLVYPLSVVSGVQDKIKPGKPIFFSEKEKAEKMVRSFKEHYSFLYDEEVQGERVYCIIIEEYAMNSPYRYQLSTSVYSPEGDLLNDCMIPDDGPFLGRPTSKIHHFIGDLVEIPCGERLVFGIVAEQPLCMCEENATYELMASDDCYTIIQHPDHEINYAHTPMVFKPSREIEEEIKTDLNEALCSFKKYSSVQNLEIAQTRFCFNPDYHD